MSIVGNVIGSASSGGAKLTSNQNEVAMMVLYSVDSNPIVGNTIGGGSGAPKSVIFQTEDGQEMHAVLVGSEVIFTAGPNDIREGKIAANANGVVIGTKVIPTYHTSEGFQIVLNGQPLSITGLDKNYNYTKLQAIICAFNTNVDNSMSAQLVSIEDSVYNVQSTIAISEIVKNNDTKAIDLGITNNSGNYQIIRYVTYREIE